MRKSLATLAVAVTALLQFVAFPSNAGADQWTPPGVPHQIAIVNQSLFQQTSHLSANWYGNTAAVLCTEYSSSGPCQFDAQGNFLEGQVMLPACMDVVQTNCIASMSMGKSKDSLVVSTFQRMSAGPTVNMDPQRDLPEGSTIGLWSNSLSSASGSNMYATSVGLQLGFSNGKYTFTNLEASVVPYSLINGSEYRPITNVVNNQNSTIRSFGQDGLAYGCIWTDTGVCGHVDDFQQGTFVSMTLRLSNKIGGWFKARMKSPDIKVSTFNSSSNVIEITGQSVDVPEVAVSVPESATGLAGLWNCTNCMGYASFGGATLQSDSVGTAGIINLIRSLANNSASGIINIWNFGSLPAAGNSCLTSTASVLGLVTTNAMAYDGSVPSFANGFLTYNVAGMHYMPDGVTPVQGTYDMVMADSVARCLYGFSNAPISGTISVSEENGVQNVATTTVSDVGGWVHLAAYGFNFSNPVITAKLTQAAPVVVVPPVAIVAPAKKTTITCVNTKNKKLIKKITAVKPVCPSGYKKV